MRAMTTRARLGGDGRGGREVTAVDLNAGRPGQMDGRRRDVGRCRVESPDEINTVILLVASSTRWSQLSIGRRCLSADARLSS